MLPKDAPVEEAKGKAVYGCIYPELAEGTLEIYTPATAGDYRFVLSDRNTITIEIQPVVVLVCTYKEKFSLNLSLHDQSRRTSVK